MSDLIIGIFVMGIIPIVLLILVIRSITKKSHPDGGESKHAYYYLVSFITLAILYWAINDLIRLVFGADWSGIATSYSNRLLQQAEVRLSTILVALPLWTFHFMKAFPPKDFPIDLASRKVYALGVTLCSVFIMIPGWIVILYSLMLIGIREPFVIDIVLSILSYTIIATILWWVHFKMWKRLNEKPISKTTPELSD